MSVSEAVAAPVDEIVESMEVAPRNGFHLEPRCRVCRNDQVREKVNDHAGHRGELCPDRTRPR